MEERRVWGEVTTGGRMSGAGGHAAWLAASWPARSPQPGQPLPLGVHHRHEKVLRHQPLPRGHLRAGRCRARRRQGAAGGLQGRVQHAVPIWGTNKTKLARPRPRVHHMLGCGCKLACSTSGDAPCLPLLLPACLLHKPARLAPAPVWVGLEGRARVHLGRGSRPPKWKRSRRQAAPGFRGAAACSECTEHQRRRCAPPAGDGSWQRQPVGGSQEHGSEATQ